MGGVIEKVDLLNLFNHLVDDVVVVVSWPTTENGYGMPKGTLAPSSGLTLIPAGIYVANGRPLKMNLIVRYIKINLITSIFFLSALLRSLCTFCMACSCCERTWTGREVAISFSGGGVLGE